jgi:hypothetical protein
MSGQIFTPLICNSLIHLDQERFAKDWRCVRPALNAMQSTRKAAYAKAEAEAILLTQLAHAKGQTVDAAKDFRPPNSAVALFIRCPKSLASSVAPPAWPRPTPASKWRRSRLRIRPGRPRLRASFTKIPFQQPENVLKQAFFLAS